MSEIIKIIIGVFNSAYIETILFPSKFLGKKPYINHRNLLIILLSLPVLYYSDYIIMPLRLVVIVFIYSIMIKLIYNKNIKLSLVIGIYSYSLGFLSDAINAIMYLKIFKIDISFILQHIYLQYTMYFTFLAISVLITYIIRPRKLFSETEEFLLKNDTKTVTKYITLILSFMCLLGYMVATQPYLSPQHMASVLSLVLFIIINDMYIKQIKITEKTKNDLDEIYYYATELEKAQSQLKREEHENKNQLITVKILIENKEYEKVKLFINEIIKVDDYAVLNIDTDYQMIKDVMLKQLLIYKTNRAAENGIMVETTILQEINNVNVSARELSNIINIIMDNAIEAASASIKKCICILIDKYDAKINITIGNTYENINLELDLYKKGNSTKGKGRGNGLSILQEIEEENPNIQINTIIREDLFIQEIAITSKEEDN